MRRLRFRLSLLLWLVIVAAAFLSGVRYGKYQESSQSATSSTRKGFFFRSSSTRTKGFIVRSSSVPAIPISPSDLIDKIGEEGLNVPKVYSDPVPITPPAGDWR
jgi:hypothetical protein